MLRRGRIVSVLCVIFVGAIFSSVSGEETESYLLKIDLPNRDAIYDLVDLKVSVLQELSDYVIAEVEKGYLDHLEREGFDYEILDENPKKNLYYLVLVLSKGDLQTLERYGKVLSFDGRTAILKITVKDVEGLFSHRFMIKKLRKSPIRLRKKVDIEYKAIPETLVVDPLIEEMVAQVSQEDITEYIQTLQGFGTRYSYIEGCEEASVHIYNQFDSMGLDVEYHDFGDSMADNVIATLSGVVDPDKIYVICAHYDSTSNDPWNDAPGADDNGSGCAAVLETASILIQYDFNYTIRFICFSGEEQGLIGSGDHASEAAASGDDIVGVLNFDMIGYVDVPPEDLDIIGNYESEWLVDQMVSAAEIYTTLDPDKSINPGVLYGDHASFWDEGYNALCGIEDFWPNNPYYHTTNDTIDTLTLDFTTEVTKLGVATIAELAEPCPSGVVLLFDTSGSMAWKHDGTVGVPIEEQRLTLAKEAVYPFMEMLNDFNSGKANFGIATFPSHPASYPWSCTAQIVTPMTLITDDRKDTAVTTTIPGLSMEDNTPLLAGVGTSAGMFGFGPKTNKAIILLSDGYHNCPSFASVGDPEVTDLIDQLNAKSIRVFTIGFGRPTDVNHLLLQTFADETAPPEFIGSQFYDVTTPDFDPGTWDPAVALQETYKAILADALGLETAADPRGIIIAGAKKTFDVKINEHDRRVSFFLSWVTPEEGRLRLIVKSSDGQEVPTTGTGIRFHEGKTYKILTVDKSFLQHGKVAPTPWKIEIDASGLDSGERENYQYSVILDSALKMKTAFDKTSYGTGDSITITARITEAKRPVVGLTDVHVKVTRPEDGAGNWFVANKVSAEELKQIPEKRGDENLSPVLRKAIFLTDIRKVAFPGRASPITLPLYDDDTHGDISAGDGIYTNRFTNTLKEGVYSFYFQATGPTSGGNAFDRDDVIQKNVTVNVATEYILVNIIRLPSVEDKVKQFKVIITPKDALGNYLGPRYSGMVKLTASRGRFINVLRDNIDGTYSQILQLPTTVDVNDVDITVDAKGATLFFNLTERLKTPYSASFHLGGTIPIGNFNNNYDPDYSIGLNFDYHFTPQLSAVGLIGYNHFISGAPSVSNTYWWNISANFKYEFITEPLRPYVNGGPGIYIPETGSTRIGFNIGLGLGYLLTSDWTIEFGADYHNIFTSGDDVRFIVPHLVVVYQF